MTIFNLYDWSTASGQDYGLVDLQSDGMGGANRVYTESYYAYRLMTRGLVKGKDRLSHTASGFSSETRTLVTRDADYIYVIVLRNNGTQPATVNVDVSALRGGGGAATVWEYSATNKDVVVETPTITNGQFSFTAPAMGISLARVNRVPTAVQLERMTATTESETSRTTAKIVLVLGLLALGALVGGGVIASRTRPKIE